MTVTPLTAEHAGSERWLTTGLCEQFSNRHINIIALMHILPLFVKNDVIIDCRSFTEIMGVDV